VRRELQRVTDYFALLNEPRRPWLDPDSLKQKFLLLSAEVHPDRVHQASQEERQTAQERYTTLNSAYTCLREPKERLRHLLELETGSKAADVQNVPAGLMEQFMDVSAACREADSLVAEKKGLTSPLLKAQLFGRGQDNVEKLMSLQQRFHGSVEALLGELKGIDLRWSDSSAERAQLLPRLREIAELLSYFSRWNAQLQERIVQLSF
jgi:curved DNA-binding protein CbpA